jgi:thiamine-monophosphate kinase
LLKTDCVVEGIHFTTESGSVAVGWKAMARPLSDFAAMSGVPEFALITLIAPAQKSLAWVKNVYRGLEQSARAFRVVIVGGETSNTHGPAVISVSATGYVEKDRMVTRSGGQANDELFVTGRLGGSLGGRHLKFIPRITESRWLTENFSIHAMIDLSDGLGADLPRLARASGLAFELEESMIPRNFRCSLRQAIEDGEDYELLFAISARHGTRLLKRWRKRFPKLPLTRIGKLKSKLENRNSKLFRGYVHFK